MLVGIAGRVADDRVVGGSFLGVCSLREHSHTEGHGDSLCFFAQLDLATDLYPPLASVPVLWRLR